MLTSITPLNIFYKNPKTNNQSFDAAVYKMQLKLNPLKQDTFTQNDPAFTGISSASAFRNIVNHRPVHCLYCGRLLMGNKLITKLQNKGTFSGSIRNFACEMMKYIDYLHPSEKETLKRIVIMSFDEPDINLSDAIKNLCPAAKKELLKKQKNILEELSVLSEKLPDNYKTKYQKLLQITEYQIEEKPYVPTDFNIDEFVYKIRRLCETIEDKRTADDIIRTTYTLTGRKFKNYYPTTRDKLKRTLTKYEYKICWQKKLYESDLQVMMLQRIKHYAKSLKRDDIINYCDMAIKTIEKRPVTVKFSNKSFRYALNEVLDGIQDENLQKEINEITKQLPTSRTSVNAFIIKHEFAAPDAIGYDLFRPSFATIEHMLPTSEDGANELYNYALACAQDNNTRRSENMQTFIKPFDIKNQKKYFSEIMEEVYQGNISLETFLEMLDVFIRESGRNIDIKDL